MSVHLHDLLSTWHARLRDSRLAMFGLNRLPRVYEFAFGWMGEPLYQRVVEDAARAPWLAAGDRVVDIGTGPGRVPRLLHRLRPDLEVEGVDVSAEMIQGARATAARDEPITAGTGRLSYSVADVGNLPHPDQSVALVLSSLSLHHWPNPEAGIAEIRRVLRAGGRVWIYDVRSQLETTRKQLDAQGIPAQIQALPRKSGTGLGVRYTLIRRWIARLELH